MVSLHRYCVVSRCWLYIDVFVNGEDQAEIMNCADLPYHIPLEF